MGKYRTLLALVALLLSLTASTGVAEPSPAGGPAGPGPAGAFHAESDRAAETGHRAQNERLVAGLGPGFSSGSARVNGTSLHYVRGGRGPAVLLVHGHPQDWSEYREVMPRLARRFTVVAVDLRGIGGSTPTPGGYDAPNLAEDLRQLVRRLDLGPVHVVGHDIGGMVAYAYARLNPATTRGAMVLDVPLPGVEPWSASTAGLWHLGFHQAPGLAEDLIDGRQEVYLRFALPAPTFSDAEVARYSRAYRPKARLRAGFELYRAFPANAEFNAARRERLDVPLVWVAGDRSIFAGIGPDVVRGLRDLGAADVRSEVVEGSDHYLLDHRPDAVAALVERYASR
ncbi:MULTISPECIES: alpha/beta fold hydrolase [Actinosynnema]|uniref:alpha/beta fold hydrolase n=1 Tax=Actinosynnema TaxID=40566 RepID=UPI0020A4AEEF|nr:alpha/beta hydrolase [Actinosynnema pretiosum]MCP2094956.1 Pimeloyl-ACP methyl ester carboxylesterase [Actinosynnema pretiosum]